MIDILSIFSEIALRQVTDDNRIQNIYNAVPRVLV